MKKDDGVSMLCFGGMSVPLTAFASTSGWKFLMKFTNESNYISSITVCTTEYEKLLINRSLGYSVIKEYYDCGKYLHVVVHTHVI